MAMKGKHPTEELAALAARSASQAGAGVDVFHVEPLHVPGLDAERCMVWMRPAVAA
jgi:16S rRNA (guanine527-N7)-methyltransferase